MLSGHLHIDIYGYKSTYINLLPYVLSYYSRGCPRAHREPTRLGDEQKQCFTFNL